MVFVSIKLILIFVSPNVTVMTFCCVLGLQSVPKTDEMNTIKNLLDISDIPSYESDIER